VLLLRSFVVVVVGFLRAFCILINSVAWLPLDLAELLRFLLGTLDDS